MWSLQVIVFSWVRCRNCRITPVRLVESAQWSAGLILSDHIRGSRIFMRWTLILQNALFCNVLFALLPSLIFCYGVLETNQRKPWPRGLLLFCKHLTVQKRKRNCAWFESVLTTERFSGPKQLQKDFLRLSECLCKREIISATVSKRNCCPLPQCWTPWWGFSVTLKMPPEFFHWSFCSIFVHIMFNENTVAKQDNSRDVRW